MIVEPRRIKVYYQCSWYPKCVLHYVRDLVRNHISWLITGGSRYIQLWRVFENILVRFEDAETSKTRECYKSASKSGACPKSVLVCKTTIIDTTQKNHQCAESKSVPVQVYLKIMSDTNRKSIQHMIDFTCDFDNCNSINTGQLIRQTINKQFDFLPFFTTSLLKILSSITTTTATIRSTSLTTTKSITTTKIKRGNITNIALSYPTTNYETQTNKLTTFSLTFENDTHINELTTFSSIIQNKTRFTTSLRTELTTNSGISLPASGTLVICMILLYAFCTDVYIFRLKQKD